MKYYNSFAIILTIIVILTGGGTACNGPCENTLRTDSCQLFTESRFRCVYKTKFIDSSSFNITSFQNKRYNCKTTSVNRGTVTFDCPFNQNHNFLLRNLTITALGSTSNGDTRVINISQAQIFCPSNVSNVKISASDNAGIHLYADIYHKTIKKVVFVTFSSIHNFHEPINESWNVSGTYLNTTEEGLHPYEEYVVGIYWKIEMGNYCSPVTFGSIRTQPSIPSAAPQILKGSYSDTLHDNKSALYWKTISNYNENGPSVKYIIYKLPTHIMKDNYKLLHNFTSLIELDNVSHYFNISNLERFRIATVEESDTSLIFSHDVVPGDHLMIRTSNAVGPSDAYSSIEFTSKGKHIVQHFNASQLNQTHFELNCSTITLTTSFEVILYWCYGYYWPLPEWTECKNNISEITISSSELEITESSFRLIQMISLDKLPQTIDTPSSPQHNPVASKIIAADDTLPPNHLHFGVSIYYDDEFSPIVWNNTNRPDAPLDEQNQLVIYIIIAVIVLIFILLIICLYCRLRSSKGFFKKYEVTMPANFEKCDSENGTESTALPTNNSNHDVDKQRPDSGVGTLSISTPSSCSSPRIIIPSTSTPTNSFTDGSPDITSTPTNTSTSSPVIIVSSSAQDASSNDLSVRYLPKAKPVPDLHTSKSLPVLMFKPKSQSTDKVTADESPLMDYSIATIPETKDKESESEGSSSPTSVPFIKNISRPTLGKHKLQGQIVTSDNSDMSDNDYDENYPPTSLVIRPDSKEIMC